MLVRSSLVLAIAASGACIFGSGPQPSAPSEAQVLFVAPQGQQCTQSLFIDAVVVSGPTGYAILAPYTPINSNCNSSGPVMVPLDVYQFDTAAAGNPNGMMVAGNSNAGMSNVGPLPPRLTVGTSGPLWAFTDVASQTKEIGPPDTTLTLPPGFDNGPVAPTGIAAIGSNVYVALEHFTGGTSYTSPGSPEFSGNTPGAGGTGGLFLVTSLPMQMPQTPTMITIPSVTGYSSDQAFDVITSNSTTVYFVMTAPTGPGATIFGVQSGQTSASQIETIPAPGDTGLPPDLAPVGLDADDSHIVWAAAPQIVAGRQDFQPGCAIWMHTLPSGPTKLLFHTPKLTCFGPHMDNGHVYFAIVRREPVGDCGGCPQPIHGDGLGRVDLTDTPDFASIAVGFTGLGAGPRRVYVDYAGDAIFAVDPLAIGRIAKSAFDGHHDFQVEPDALAH
jgi:hypothetical protein